MSIDLFACLRVLPTDYDAYGGEALTHSCSQRFLRLK